MDGDHHIVDVAGEVSIESLLAIQDSITRLLARDITKPEMIETLNTISNVLESEEEKYQNQNNDPFDDRREDHSMGTLLRVVHDNEEVLYFMVTRLLHDTDHNVCAAAARALLAASPGRETDITHFTHDEDSALNKIMDFVKTGPSPLRIYATGLLALAMEQRDATNHVVNSGIFVTLLQRLKEISYGSTNKFSPEMDIKDLKLAELETIYLLQALAAMGEYQEVLGPFLQEGGVELLMSFLKTRHVHFQYETLTFINQLLAHKKFASVFVERGGMQLLVEVPRIPYLSGALANCLYGFADLSAVMEMICLLPHPVPTVLVKHALWLLTCDQDHTRKHAALFFSLALAFRTILQLFDQMNGLNELINLLKQLSTPEPATHQSKQVVLHVCLTLRQYVRAHFMILTEGIRRKVNKPGSGQSLLPVPGYKPIDLDPDNVMSSIEMLEKHRSTVAPFLNRIRWHFVELLSKIGGLEVLLNLIQLAGSWRVPDIAQFSLETLHIITTVPFTHADVMGTSLENGKTGISLILDATSGTGAYNNPEVIKAGLLVVCNCVCRAMGKSHKGHPDNTPHKPHTQNECAPGAPPSTNTTTTTTPVKTAPSLTTAPITPSKDQAATDEHLRRVWKSVRDNNGIKVLLSLLKIKTPQAHADLIRALACYALLGLARDPTIVQILGKLQVSLLLPDLIREPVQEEKSADHARFRQYALELISRLAGKGTAAALSEATDPASRKIEKAAIVARTPVHYSSGELLQLIHHHLVANGLQKTADMLKDEASLSGPLVSSNPIPPNHNTLDKIVTQFLVDQHRRCPDPIAVVPSFSLFEPHTCPSPPRPRVPPNIATRLFSRQAIVPHGGVGGRRLNRKLIFCRFRPLKQYRDEDCVLTCARFLTNDKLICGSHGGDVKIFDVKTTDVLDSWNAMDRSIWHLDLTTNKQLLITSSPHGESRLFSLKDTSTPRATLTDCTKALFNHQNTQFVGTYDSKAVIYDVETVAPIKVLQDATWSNNYKNNSACFSLCDDLVLNDGVLWDPRYPRIVHKFDKFTNYGEGIFHHAGNEVIINSEIWDLRTFKLLRTVPALDQTHIIFNSLGDIMYAVVRQAEFGHRRSKNPYWNSFRTFDSSDYSLISTIDLERSIYDLCVDYNDNNIAIVENTPFGMSDSICRLYEVGRRKPSDSDSDVDADDDDDDDDDGDDDDDDDDSGNSSGGLSADDGGLDDVDDDDDDGLGDFSDEDYMSYDDGDVDMDEDGDEDDGDEDDNDVPEDGGEDVDADGEDEDDSDDEDDH